MTRRILITLGSTTDAERCGDCPHGGYDHRLRTEVAQCHEFDAYRDEGVTHLDWMRLPECLAAEEAAEERTP